MRSNGGGLKHTDLLKCPTQQSAKPQRQTFGLYTPPITVRTRNAFVRASFTLHRRRRRHSFPSHILDNDDDDVGEKKGKLQDQQQQQQLAE